MTDLIQKLLDEERPVVAFPIHESWLDIGEHEDYLEAQSIVKETGRRK
jgi:NDP-sugar pyrophosphorylase family protein